MPRTETAVKQLRKEAKKAYDSKRGGLRKKRSRTQASNDSAATAAVNAELDTLEKEREHFIANYISKGLAPRIEFLEKERLRKRREREKKKAATAAAAVSMSDSLEPRPTGTMSTPRPPQYRDEPPPVSTGMKQNTPVSPSVLALIERSNQREMEMEVTASNNADGRFKLLFEEDKQRVARTAEREKRLRDAALNGVVPVTHPDDLSATVRQLQFDGPPTSPQAQPNATLAAEDVSLTPDDLSAAVRELRFDGPPSPQAQPNATPAAEDVTQDSDSQPNATPAADAMQESPPAQPHSLQDSQPADKESKTSMTQPRVVTPIGDFDLDNWSVNDQAHFEEMFAAFLKKFWEIGNSNAEAAWKLFYRFVAFCTVDHGRYYNALFAKDPLPELLAKFLRFLHEQGFLQESEMTGEGLKSWIQKSYIVVLFQIGTHVKYRELDEGVVKLHDVTIVEQLDAIDPGSCKIRFNSDDRTKTATIDRIEPLLVPIPKANTVPQEPPTDATQESQPHLLDSQPADNESKTSPTTPKETRVVTPIGDFDLDNWSVNDQAHFEELFAGFLKKFWQIVESNSEAAGRLLFRFIAFCIVQYEGYYNALFAKDPLPDLLAKFLRFLHEPVGFLQESEMTGEGLKSAIKEKYIAIVEGKHVKYRELDEGNTFVKLHDVTIVEVHDVGSSCDIRFNSDGRTMSTTIDRIEPLFQASPPAQPLEQKTATTTPIPFSFDNWIVQNQSHFEQQCAALLKKLSEIASTDEFEAWKLFFRFFSYCIIQYEGYYDAFFAKLPLPDVLTARLSFLCQIRWLQETQVSGEGLKSAIRAKYIAVVLQKGKHVKYRELDEHKSLVKLHDVTIEKVHDDDLGSCVIRFHSDGRTRDTSLERIEPLHLE